MRVSEKYMVSFSGGRTSAYMTERLLQQLPPGEVVVCFANTGKEEEATLLFVHQCDQRWGGIIHWIEYDQDRKFREVSYQTASRQGEPYATLIARRKYLPNVVTRYCTQDLKIRPIKWYMRALGYRYWTNVVGIRFDEPRRWAKTCQLGDKECWDTWLPLVEWKITKEMVLAFWMQMPFNLNLKEHQGNCDMCFLKGKHKIQAIVRETPQKAQWWIDQETLVGATFHKDYSYKGMLEQMRNAPTLFDEIEPDIDCFCNVD